jgi:hypothetical protein
MKNLKLFGLAVVGWILFNYPIVGIFNKSTWFFGIPSAITYLFLGWLVFVVLIRQLVEPIDFRKRRI